MLISWPPACGAGRRHTFRAEGKHGARRLRWVRSTHPTFARRRRRIANKERRITNREVRRGAVAKEPGEIRDILIQHDATQSEG